MCGFTLEGKWYLELCLKCREKVHSALHDHEVESLFDRTPEEWRFCDTCLEHIEEVQREGF